jgi:hypothetical protein
MLFLLEHVIQAQSMRRLQTGLVLLSRVPKAGLEKKSQENLQETYDLEQAQRICTRSQKALEPILSRAGIRVSSFVRQASKY